MAKSFPSQRIVWLRSISLLLTKESGVRNVWLWFVDELEFGLIYFFLFCSSIFFLFAIRKTAVLSTLSSVSLISNTHNVKLISNSMNATGVMVWCIHKILFFSLVYLPRVSSCSSRRPIWNTFFSCVCVCVGFHHLDACYHSVCSSALKHTNNRWHNDSRKPEASSASHTTEKKNRRRMVARGLKETEKKVIKYWIACVG